MLAAWPGDAHHNAIAALRVFTPAATLGTCASARAIREARMIHRAAPRHVVGMFLRKFLHRGAACLRLDGCEQRRSHKSFI
jgi:hypothetical protein